MPKPGFAIYDDGYMNAQTPANSVAMHTIFHPTLGSALQLPAFLQ